MGKILIVYGSVTGNTESIAHLIEKKFAAAGHEVTVKSAGECKAAGLAEGFDAVLLGASCWGEDEIEMQEDFAALMGDADKMGLSGKLVAAFASGDQSYQYFCGAVDVVEEEAPKLGATLAAEGLRLEGDGGSDDAAVGAFADAVMAKL